MKHSVQNHIWIDPENCESAVGYHIHVDEYTPKGAAAIHSVHGTVSLSDCHRKIEWGFSESEGSRGSIEKIDEALEMLMEFRKEYIAANKLATELNK